MPSDPSTTDGPALIAPSYHITIHLLPNSTVSSSIRAIGPSNQSSRPHRPFATAASDFMHEHFTWNTEPGRGYKLRPRLKSEYEIVNDAEIDEAVKRVRQIADQGGERVPDKKEARAMARLVRSGRVVARKCCVYTLV